MPVKESLEDVLKRLKDFGKDLWIDLKCRQLRVVGYAVAPFTEITVSHRLSVNTPATAYFNDGKESATLVGVDGNRLLMLNGPKRVVGPGESINILEPSLKIEGYLTDNDKKYIEAGNKTGVKNFMLSYIEQKEDIECLKQYSADAVIVAKIESRKGINFMEKEYDGKIRLMAARGDLYVELQRPHHIILALETIISKDKNAIAASRIFPSFSEGYEPSCQDISDVDNLMRMGYKTFMLGDDICMNRDSVICGLNLLDAIAEHYGG
jgi:pyruvate kinase